MLLELCRPVGLAKREDEARVHLHLLAARRSSSRLSRSARSTARSAMDAFRTLTGGSRFDKKRFQSDITHFTVRPLSPPPPPPPSCTARSSSPSPLPLPPSSRCTGRVRHLGTVHLDRPRRARLLRPARRRRFVHLDLDQAVQGPGQEGPQAQAHRRRCRRTSSPTHHRRLRRPPAPPQDQVLGPRPAQPGRLARRPRPPRTRPRLGPAPRQALVRHGHEGPDRRPDGRLGHHARRASPLPLPLSPSFPHSLLPN